MSSRQRSAFSIQRRQIDRRVAEVLRVVCDRCGEVCHPRDPSWRWEGHWRHQCTDAHPQAGHIGLGIPDGELRP